MERQTIIGALRIKNESRWIKRVLESIIPVCDTIIVLDDHSTDGTPEICEALGVTVIRSPFEGLNESRDKQFLLGKAYEFVGPEWHAHHDAPFWMLAIDGDEELVAADQRVILDLVQNPAIHCYSLLIQYLWDSPDQWRVDGVYGNFRRPSLFRLMNPEFRYKTTPFGKDGANFHCSSTPQEMIHHARVCDARLLHWGYIDREKRIAKYEWYNEIDPSNHGEDCYRHCIQGDVPEIPATARLKWAGPLELRAL
jgi:glycosyltransferase involved in cell wall biosynthesis